MLKNEFFNIPSDLPLFTIHFEEDPLRGVCCEKGLDFSRAADVIYKMNAAFGVHANAPLSLRMRRVLRGTYAVI